MKKIYTLLACLAPLTAAGQSSITDAWKAMPDSLVPYLNANVRAEMADTYKPDANVPVKNLLDGNSTMTQLADGIATIQLNAATRMQMMLLHTPDSTNIICVARTYGEPAAESCVEFYTTSWQLLDGSYGLPDLSAPESLTQFLTEKPDTMDRQRFEETLKCLEPVTVTAELAVIGNTPTVTLNVCSPMLTNREREELKATIKQKSFKWNGKIFK